MARASKNAFSNRGWSEANSDYRARLPIDRPPIIVAYTVFDQAIRNPSALANYWPSALATRINNETASAIHIPFKQAPIYEAIEQFSHENLPLGGGLGFYNDAAYRSWGLNTSRHTTARSNIDHWLGKLKSDKREIFRAVAPTRSESQAESL